MAATSNTHNAFLYPAIRKAYFNHFTQLESHLSRLYTVEKSDRNFEVMVPLGAMPDISIFNGSLSKITANQSYTKTVSMQRWAAQVEIERDLVEDDQTGAIRRGFSQGLAEAARRTREKFGMEPYNSAFTAGGAGLGPDNVAFISAAHPTTASAVLTFSNTLGTVAFTYGQLQAALQTTMQLRDDQGNPVDAYGDTVLYHPTIDARVREAVISTDRPDTPNRALSTHNGNPRERVEGESGARIKLICSRYLTSPFRWFVGDSRLFKKFFLWYDREPVDLMKASDWNTLMLLMAITWRCGRGFVDWRGWWASNATA